MLKQGSFVKKNYYKIFILGIFGALATSLSSMLDSVLSGNQLGETALTAVSIVSPLAYIIYSFTGIYAHGYGLLYGQYTGEFNTDKAYKTAGQALVTALTGGTLIAAFLLAVKNPFLVYYGCTGDLYTQASAYYNWQLVTAILRPFYYTLLYLIEEDADSLLISAGGAASVVVKLVFSATLCNKLGVSGLGMGTALSIVSCIAVFCIHFLRKTNSIHFKLSFNFKTLGTAIKLSTTTSLAYLFAAITDMAINKVILITSGVAMVGAYAVINLIYSLYEVYYAAASASEGFISTYYGERNNKGIKTVIKTTLHSVCQLGLILTVLLFVFAPQFPKLYGMESPELVDASLHAVRWMAIAAIPYGIIYVLVYIYPAFGKVALGNILSVLNDFICSMAFSVGLALFLGFKGISIGQSVKNFAVIAVFSVLAIIKYGKEGFPFYLEDYGEESFSFDLEVNEKSIIEIRDKVVGELNAHGYETGHTDLLIEELYKRILEKNPDKKVISECTLLFGSDYVRIITRDNGIIFNFMDANNKVESINAHVLNSLLEIIRDKDYALTTSFNRNAFIFKKNYSYS